MIFRELLLHNFNDHTNIFYISKFRHTFIVHIISLLHTNNYNFTFTVDSDNPKHTFKVSKIQSADKS